MRRANVLFFCFFGIAWCAAGAPGQVSSAAQASSGQPTSHTAEAVTEPVAAADGGISKVVDGIAARIADDILSESEVRELGAFQQLVEGQAKSRADRIRELADQWIVRAEAEAAGYPRPAAEDVEHASQQLVARFRSAEQFQERCAALALSPPAIRRMLDQQLYLARFLDFRFRPAVQVDEKQIEDYYQSELRPPLQASGQPVPTIESVAETIREVLVQRAISARAAQWLDETRQRVKIDVAPGGAEP